MTFRRATAKGRTVIIENQLESSDHVHLGQLLVYAAGRRADVIVWVATRFRDEYRAALDWLNEHTGPETAFFGVEVGVVRIGSSAPAPVLDVVVQPNDWGKAQKVQTQATQGASPVSIARQDFFRRVFEQIAERLPAFRIPRASVENWAPFKSGPFGSYSIVFAQSALRVEVYLDSSASPDLPKSSSTSFTPIGRGSKSSSALLCGGIVSTRSGRLELPSIETTLCASTTRPTPRRRSGGQLTRPLASSVSSITG